MHLFARCFSFYLLSIFTLYFLMAGYFHPLLCLLCLLAVVGSWPVCLKSVARGQGISLNRPKCVVSLGIHTPNRGQSRYVASFNTLLSPLPELTATPNQFYFINYIPVEHNKKPRWRRCVCTNVQPH